jgi:hypothetical protein
MSAPTAKAVAVIHIQVGTVRHQCIRLSSPHSLRSNSCVHIPAADRNGNRRQRPCSGPLDDGAIDRAELAAVTRALDDAVDNRSHRAALVGAGRREGLQLPARLHHEHDVVGGEDEAATMRRHSTHGCQVPAATGGRAITIRLCPWRLRLAQPARTADDVPGYPGRGGHCGVSEERTSGGKAFQHVSGLVQVRGSPWREKNHKPAVNHRTINKVNTAPPRTGSTQPGRPFSRKPSIFDAYAP